MKITFRKHPKNTGLSSMGHPYTVTDIKGDGKVFGSIVPPSWDSKTNEWVVMISIIKKDILEDGNPNCKWKWAKFKTKFLTEPQAREFILNNQEVIESCNLHFFD